MESADTKPVKGRQSKKKEIEHDLIFSGSDEDPFPEIECDLCSKMFSSVSMYEQHLNSKKHYQMLTKQKMKRKVEGLQKENGEPIENGDDVEADEEELTCDICQRAFSGYVPFSAHLHGSSHLKKVKQRKLKESLKDMPQVLPEGELENTDDDEIMQKPYARCSACEKNIYDPRSLKQHLAGVAHKKIVKKLELMEKLKSELPADSAAGNEDDELFSKCTVCNKSFSGPVPYKIHLMSSVHLKEVKKAQSEEELKDFFIKDSSGVLVCNTCKKTFPDAMALKSHLDNNSHEKTKIKDELFNFVSSNPEIVAVKSVQNFSSDDESEDKGGYRMGRFFLVCKLCHVSFTGAESAKAHVQSKKHIKIKRDKREMKKLKEMLKEGEAAADSNKQKENGSGVDGTVDAAIPPSNMNDHKQETAEDFELL